MKKNSVFSVRQITYAAIFIAISIIINSLRIGIVSFGGFPIILSGFALGPVMGFVVGFLSDFLGFIVRPSSTGTYHPLFGLTSAFTAVIPVVIAYALGDRYPKYTLWKIFIGILIGQFITSVFVAPYFVDKLFAPGTFVIKMIAAAKKQLITAPIYAYLCKVILDVTTKQFNFRNL